MKRESNFELMRIISMLLILAFHYQIHIDADTVMYSAFCKNQLVAILAGSWGTLGSNLFFIVASYFLIKCRRYNKLKMIKLMIKTSFFGVILLCIAFACGLVEFDLWWLIKSVFSPMTYMYWFVTAYIILCLISPVLNNIIDNLDRDYFFKLLIGLYFVAFIMTVIVGYFDLMGRMGCVIFMYLLVGYLEREDTKKNIFEKYAYPGFFLISTFIVFYEVIVSYIATHVYAPIQAHILIFEGTQSPLMVLNSFFCFYIFKNLKIKDSKAIIFGGGAYGRMLFNTWSGAFEPDDFMGYYISRRCILS